MPGVQARDGDALAVEEVRVREGVEGAARGADGGRRGERDEGLRAPEVAGGDGVGDAEDVEEGEEVGDGAGVGDDDVAGGV